MSFFDQAFNLVSKGADFIFGDKSETVSKVFDFTKSVGQRFFDGDGDGSVEQASSAAFINQNLARDISAIRVGVSSTGGNLRQYVRGSKVTAGEYVQRSPSYASLVAAINSAVGDVGTKKIPMNVGRISLVGRTKAPKSLSSLT